ncbi:MAG: sulfite exporter TauE/SafE family protein [Myxococcales bacterium]|nr:sulfite exporter TauE/SafE family protein [Myxococcales bacterium]
MTAALATAGVGLALGLFGSVHCASMCGGIASAYCAKRTAPGASVAFSAGRVISYAALGAAFGALGAGSGALLPADTVKLALRGLAAVVMLFVGLSLVGLPSPLARIEALGKRVFAPVAPLASRMIGSGERRHAVLAGLVWGLIPCGMIYSALALAASAGSAASGALVMAAFGLGTLPMMAALGAVVSVMAKRRVSSPWPRRVAGGLVLGFGIFGAAQSVMAAGALDGLAAPRGAKVCCPNPSAGGGGP